ncbi:hypothetical protein CP02DC14_0277A, partial [Chlamydia psittaci 02DC14]
MLLISCLPLYILFILVILHQDLVILKKIK